MTLAACAALLGAAGCEPGGTTGLDDQGLGILAGGATNAPVLDVTLVGTWSRTVLLTGASGAVQSTETRWTFGADGRVERRVLITDFGFGLGDQIITVGDWSTVGSTPGAGVLLVRVVGAGASEPTLRYDYRIVQTLDGTFLSLGDQLYQQTAP